MSRRKNRKRAYSVPVRLLNLYSCGAELFPPDEKRKLAKSMTVRPNLTCADQIEIPYYGDNDIESRKDLCSHCGDSNAAKSQVLKEQFKTVLPMCKNCGDVGKLPFTQRPYGKSKK